MHRQIADHLAGLVGLAEVQGAPAEARANVLASYKGKDFILDPANGKSLMQRGFGHLQEAVRYANAAWAEVKEKPAKSWQIADPSMFTPFGVNRGISASLKTMNEMLAGPTTLHSIVTTHETITVDLKKLLNDDPPPSLLDFLPTHFATSPTDAGPKKDGMITKKDYPNEYRNYLYRSPTDWNLDAYAKYFPDIRSVGPNNADNAGRVNTAARIIAQSWGGMIFGPAAPILQ